MLIELLVVENCPHESAARALIAAALADAGLPAVPVATVLVTTVAAAEILGFTGSPTIKINGRDPFGSPGDRPGLSCRIYWTDAGLGGVPERCELREAILREAASRST